MFKNCFTFRQKFSLQFCLLHLEVDFANLLDMWKFHYFSWSWPIWKILYQLEFYFDHHCFKPTNGFVDYFCHFEKVQGFQGSLEFFEDFWIPWIHFYDCFVLCIIIGHDCFLECYLWRKTHKLQIWHSNSCHPSKKFSTIYLFFNFSNLIFIANFGSLRHTVQSKAMANVDLTYYHYLWIDMGGLWYHEWLRFS